MLVRDIIQATAQAGCMTVPALLSQVRRKDVARLRQVGMLASTRLTLRSLPAIGADWGGRDHTTVLHANRRVAQRMADGDTETCSRMRQLLDLLDIETLPETRPTAQGAPRDRAMVEADIRRVEARLAALRTELTALGDDVR
jgi:hypothetical protein